jgi:glycosyltransferase involved in cell wall biosynthesis
LIRENGAHLLVPILAEIKKVNTNIKLLIIGDGELKNKILDDIKKNNLQNNVIYYGYISDQNRILKIQSGCAIGLAPYPDDNRTRKKFGDVIKIRMYFASGLPTISTNVPPVYKEIISEKLGIVVKKKLIKGFARNIIKLLSNKKKLRMLQKNVINKSMNSSWDKTFTKALNNDEKLQIQL